MSSAFVCSAEKVGLAGEHGKHFCNAPCWLMLHTHLVAGASLGGAPAPASTTKTAAAAVRAPASTIARSPAAALVGAVACPYRWTQ